MKHRSVPSDVRAPRRRAKNALHYRSNEAKKRTYRGYYWRVAKIIVKVTPTEHCTFDAMLLRRKFVAIGLALVGRKQVVADSFERGLDVFPDPAIRRCVGSA